MVFLGGEGVEFMFGFWFKEGWVVGRGNVGIGGIFNRFVEGNIGNVVNGKVGKDIIGVGINIKIFFWKFEEFFFGVHTEFLEKGV